MEEYATGDLAKYSKNIISVSSTVVTAFEVHTKDGSGLFATTTSRRGAIPDDSPVKYPLRYPVSYFAKDNNGVKQALASVIREKVLLDLLAANDILNQMRTEGIVDSDLSPLTSDDIKDVLNLGEFEPRVVPKRELDNE